MLADFFMKPLQGSLFTKFHDIILGVNHATSVSPDSRSVLGDDATSQAQDGTTHPVVGLKVPLPEEQPTDVHSNDAQAVCPIKAHINGQHLYCDVMAGPTVSTSMSCAQTHKIKQLILQHTGNTCKTTTRHFSCHLGVLWTESAGKMLDWAIYNFIYSTIIYVTVVAK